MPERKNLSSGCNDRSRSLDRLGRLLNLGRFRGNILQRGNRLRLVNLGRMFVHFGRSSDLSLWFGLEEVTDSGGETTANFQGFGFRLWCGGCLLNFFSDNDRDGGGFGSNSLA